MTKKCSTSGFYRTRYCYLKEKVVSRESEACGEYEGIDE